MEKIKSLVLLLLVFSSVFLSAILIFYSPNSGNIALSEYLPQIHLGQNTEYQAIVRPEKIIYHQGNNNHTVVRPNQYLYSVLEKDFDLWSFYDLSLEYNRIDWLETVENQPGIEVIFPSALPQGIISSIFKLYETNINIYGVNRLWITNDLNDNVIAYFISDERDQIYVAQTSISNTKLIQYTGLASKAPKYSYHLSSENEEKSKVNLMFYLPVEGIELKKIKSSFITVPLDDLKQLLFIDPSIAKIYELENGKDYLYTDGTRSLQFFSEDRYISYFQPIAENKKEVNLENDVSLAIRYINQHGGWDGIYQLAEVKEVVGTKQTFLEFTKYIDGYQLKVLDNIFGSIQLQLTDGFVSSLMRSTIIADKTILSESITTLNDSELLQYLQKKGIEEQTIENIEIQYITSINQGHLSFDPYWVVSIAGQETIEIPADGRVVQGIGLE